MNKNANPGRWRILPGSIQFSLSPNLSIQRRSAEFLIVAIDLSLQAVFFVVQMALLTGGYKTAIQASIALLLPADRAIFALQLSKMTRESTVVMIDFAIQDVVSTQHFSPTRMVVTEGTGEAGQAGRQKNQTQEGSRWHS